MSCRCDKKDRTENCVCDILRQIVEAQRDTVDHECQIGCEQSIQDLLGDSSAPNNLDTVPVLLYCGCEPFKGFGVYNNSSRTLVASYYFRVKSVDSDCCAVLELLRDPQESQQNFTDPTRQKTANLQTTGICITVDLDCFCHVTCLPAVNACGF